MWKSILARLGEQVLTEGNTNPSMLRHWMGLPSNNEVLADHQALYKQLLSIEWQLEKQRLSRLALYSMLLFCGFFCLMFSLGTLVVVEFWVTEYRYASILALVIAYAALAIIAGLKMRSCLTDSKNSFSAIGEEIATDFDLVKRALL